MVKKIIFIALAVLVSFPLLYLPAKAKNADPPDLPDSDLPENNGVYPVPGHPELKLHVLSHPARGSRPAKPTPTPTSAPVLNCSLEDPDSSSVSGVTGWYLPPSFSYLLNSSSVPASVGAENLTWIAQNGYLQWAEALSGQVSVSFAGQTLSTRARLDGQNIITWGRAASGTLGVTYIWTYGDGEVAEADTIMNKGYAWSWSDPDTWHGSVCAYPGSYDAQNILTHELGHWFGTDDDYDQEFENNTMYGFGDVLE